MLPAGFEPATLLYTKDTITLQLGYGSFLRCLVMMYLISYNIRIFSWFPIAAGNITEVKRTSHRSPPSLRAARRGNLHRRGWMR